ncbi:MAG: aromatic amino acid exporter YddG [Maritimibacter sp.]
MSKNKATLIGFTAVLLWSLLAMFTVLSAPVPPLQLNAVSFAIGALVGFIWLVATGTVHHLRRVPIKVYLFGTLGLFGYHFLYFSALRAAPPAETGLIAYLWPLLIVLFSGLLPGEHLRFGHVLGAFIGFSGAVVLLSPNGGGLSWDVWPGYAMALMCAVTWAGYSVLSRRLGRVPTASVVVFCIATAALSALAHLALEQTIWPQTTTGWWAIIGLGIGPVGLAFYTWDIGVKRGDIQLLGTASYAAPVLSTIILVGVGIAQPTVKLFVASALIAGGAALAARSGKTSNTDLAKG